MAPRQTNLALLVLLSWALASGGLAFAIGAGWDRWVVVAHGALGLGLLLLAPWKRAIVRRGLRRQRAGTGASVALAGLVLLSLASGIAHATGVVRAVGAFTMMQVHVATAVGAIPFAVWHIVARPAKPRRTDLSRRTLLRSGVVAAGSLAAFGSVSAVTAATGLPGRRTRFTGSYPVAGEDYPVTQWLSDGIADVDPATWRLTVSSEGRELRTWSLVELNRVAEPIEGVLDCTGGWFVDETWRAVRLDRVLEAVEGRSVRAVSATGYSRRFPLADAGRLWVATGTGKAALSAGHGAPARIVAPGRRGFWWVKWLVELDVGATPWWWQPPFPLQ